MVSADVFLGAVLTQDQQWKPIAYASKALTPTEKRYAQIVKKVLGITWASECFRKYLFGMQFRVETDHKPLLRGSIVSKAGMWNNFHKFTVFIQYRLTFSCLPGKDLTVADTLSRASASSESIDDLKTLRWKTFQSQSSI